MKFSVIVVCLNAGEKLRQTVDSILKQSYTDYEIVVKDGGSSDGSVALLPKDERIRLYVEKDKSIYDAMNQAVAKTSGEYILFLNCGDTFYNEKVLEKAAAKLEREEGGSPVVLYGDTYGEKNHVMIASPGHIDGSACFRNIPCHQSCFYAAELCKEKPYDLQYRIRADYDHFLWCYYQAKARMVYLGDAVACYEGGGYSESKENRSRDKEEHRLITEKYIPEKELKKYRRLMLLTLAPVRSFLAENRFTSGLYHWIKDRFYNHRFLLLLGVLILAAELYAFLGTGVMREDVSDYLTGEGAFEIRLDDELSGLSQEFVPAYGKLQMISFLMSKKAVTKQDGNVQVMISDDKGVVLFERELAFSEIADEYFTDVTVDLTLKPRRSYYLTLVTVPSSGGEYPEVGVCSKAYYLRENGKLLGREEIPDTQLVSRYQYADVLLPSKLRNVLFICILTAFGVMFGLPEHKLVRRALGVTIMLAGPYILGSRLELLTYKEVFYTPLALKWNIGIMYGLELVVFLATWSERAAVLLVDIVLTIIYTANYFVVLYRGTPLRVNDFSAIGTATQVAGGYSFVPNDHLAMAWGILLLLVVFSLQTGKGKIREAADHKGKGFRVGKVAGRVATAAMAVGIVVLGGYKLLYTDLLTKVGFANEEFKGFYQDLIYYVDGYLVGTCIEVQNARIKPPEGYSTERVEQILKDATKNKTDVDIGEEEKAGLPHVILIMNESFADLRLLGNLDLNEENLEFFDSLKDNTVRGYVNASVLGGGTANSEFEVLTGCTSAFFSVNYYPYQQGVKRPLNSLVSQMEKYGYHTYSMHPAPATNWKRDTVYRFFGFDESLWEQDFDGAEVIHHGVSDEETFDRIIELYEGRQEGEKLFVFDLTIQNHGGYMGKNAPYEVRAEKYNNAMLDEYLTLIRISDEAFAELVSYFEKQDEKVIICMFGDHQPWVSNLIAETDRTSANVNMERLLAKYKTPFVIWANYDIEEADDYDISMNYLGGLLQETAGVPLSPYFTYLRNLREDYPVITVNGYRDAEGNYHNWGNTEPEFSEYRMLQYNYLFDSSTVKWGY